MEKLYGEFVRCIINDFSSLYKLRILFCLSLHNLLDSFLFKLEIQCHNHTVNFVMFML